MNVLGIGESVVDIESSHQNGTRAGLPSRHVGGPSAAALVVLARLGQNCKYVTSIGPDVEGKFIRETLTAEGITVIEHTQSATKVNQIHVNASNGQRQKVRSSIRHQPISSIPVDLVQEADIIIVDRHEREAFQEVVRHKRPDANLIIDPSTEVSEHTLDMVKHADYPIVPIEMCAGVSRHGDLLSGLAELYAISARPVIVTAGEIGSLIYDGTRLEFIPALDIRAVDVNGAGDVYRGAFAYGVAQGWATLQCCQFASSIAGIHCLKPGNVSAIPTREEMLSLISEGRPMRNATLVDVDQRLRQLSAIPA